ncbi:Gfo/Idh/MocA family protein [Propionibacteriaceae bacterium Y2011]|uniref:Gfo/Idh/MocA family protein n=1 Tax=Microlunatus sp. Y2014 TaxID=3418488 RepID=UPI003B49B21E
MATTDKAPGDQLGVGIIGLGSIGTTHMTAVGAVDGLELRGTVGGSGVDQVRSYDDVAGLLADDSIQVVGICSPSGLHAEHAIAALEAGKHVLVEKPVATSVADARRLVEVAERAGTVAGVVSQRRLESQHVHLKQAIDAGQFGNPVLGEALIRWHRDADYYNHAAWRRAAPGGGSLMNQGLHSVDLLRWLFGEVADVQAQTATLVADMEAEDTTVAAIRFASGALGAIVTSTATKPGLPAELNLYFSEGAVGIHHTEVVRWTGAAEPPPAASRVESGASSPIIDAEGHITQWQDLLHAINDGSQPMVTLADGAATVALIEAVYTSARTGARVTPERI